MEELCISPVPLCVQSDIFKYSESFQGYLIFTKHKEKKKSSNSNHSPSMLNSKVISAIRLVFGTDVYS